MRLRYILPLALVWCATARHAALAASEPEVVIYGATPAGIIAGVTAAREGAAVRIIEPTRWIGGMVTGGLARTDVGKEDTVGGYTRAYFELAASLSDPEVMWYAEPKANMLAFQRMLKEAGVEVITERRVTAVRRNGARISGLVTDDGAQHPGRVFIDATYEGDLMALAGVSHIIGRESQAQYGEPLAGYHPMPIRPRSPEVMADHDYIVAGSGLHYIHGTPTQIKARDAEGRLLPGVNPAPKLQPGDADRLTQSYNFRVTVTQRPEIRLPFPKPADYDPARYELLLRLIQSYPVVRFARLVHLGEIASGKYDLNAQGFFSTDYAGANADYPGGDAETRARIWREHIDYVQGLLWFLGNDTRVPAQLRAETGEWGLCKDEFTDNDHWPYALYVREARRMVGEYVMTQKDCTTEIKKPDSVGMGSFVLDCHIVQRIETEDGHVTDEGSFQDTPTRPYQIPYRSLTPKRAECENLLVPVCLSASHIACCSLRMEPVYMALGQACGNAAALAIATDQAVQEVDIGLLQGKLREQKAVLELAVPGIDSSTLAGIVVDDGAAEFVGQWQGTNYGNPVDGFSHHDGNAEKGTKQAIFRLQVPETGRYELRLAYTSAPNRAGNVPVTIEHADGDSQVTVNEKKPPTLDKTFTSLGKYRLDAAKPAVIRIENKDTDGYVSVDAVQAVEVE